MTGPMKYLLQGLITLIPALNSDDVGAQRQIDLTTAAVAATPAYGIISTPTNTCREQVGAGMLYSTRATSSRTVMAPCTARRAAPPHDGKEEGVEADSDRLDQAGDRTHPVALFLQLLRLAAKAPGVGVLAPRPFSTLRPAMMSTTRPVNAPC